MTYETRGSTQKNSGCTATKIHWLNITGSVRGDAGNLKCQEQRQCSELTMNSITLRRAPPDRLAPRWECVAVGGVAHVDVTPELPPGCVRPR